MTDIDKVFRISGKCVVIGIVSFLLFGIIIAMINFNQDPKISIIIIGAGAIGIACTLPLWWEEP